MVCDFTNQCIPVEIFGLFIGLSVGLSVFGFIRQPQIPALLTFGGIIIFTIGAVYNSIMLSQLVSSSTLNGVQTTYAYTPNIFPLTGISKVVTILLGGVMMLSGALMTFRAEDTQIW